MIHLAQLLDGPARKLKKKHDEVIQSLETTAAEKIAQYRFRCSARRSIRTRRRRRGWSSGQ